MKKTIIILTLYISANLFAQINVKTEKIFTLNDEKTTEKEYMFKNPMNIMVDDENNFYIYENMGTEIRKYSEDGKYIKTIGRYGSGPGELKHMDFVFINGKKELFIFDQMNGRDTYFDLNGKFLRSKPAKWVDHPTNTAYKYDNSSYIALVKVNNDELKHGNKILIYDNESYKVLTSFGYSGIFWKYNDVFEKHMDDWSSLKLAVGNGIVYAAKEYYDGKVFLFDKSKNWDLKISEGKQIIKPGYEVEEVHSTSGTNAPKRPYSIGFGDDWEGSNKVFSVNVRSMSLGLHLYKNEYLINFLVSVVDKLDCEFGVDVYKTDGTYVGYSKIEKGTNVTIFNKVCCMDNKGCFYLIKNGAAIAKFRLLIY